MSHRPHAYSLVKREAHAGNPPNRYVPAITAEARVYWTPTSTRDEILDALDAAHAEVLAQIDARPGDYGHERLVVGVDVDSIGLPLPRAGKLQLPTDLGDPDAASAARYAAELIEELDEPVPDAGAGRLPAPTEGLFVCRVCGNPARNATRADELRHMDAHGHAPLSGSAAQRPAQRGQDASPRPGGNARDGLVVEPPGGHGAERSGPRDLDRTDDGGRG